MHSDFAAARLFLERSLIALRGDDEFSLKAREALALLIDGCARKDVRCTAGAEAGTSNVEHFRTRPGRAF